MRTIVMFGLACITTTCECDFVYNFAGIGYPYAS
jgi:hypothetical protein